jgi:hypothetical protein
MKLISFTHGTVAVHVSVDEVVPKHGVNARDLIDFVATTYQFSDSPVLPPGVPPLAISAFNFQSGVMVTGDDKWPIMQLSIVRNGDIITAATTDIAETVLDDFMKRLDETIGYRFAAAKKRLSYVSNLVIQFDHGIEEKIMAVAKIETLLNREIHRNTPPFKIKRLTFGHGDITQLYVMPLAVEAVENADFVIERRSGEPYSDNRYFCSAPVRTQDHLRILEIFEHEMGS